MDCKIDIIPRLLHFKQPAGTSRGTYTTRKVWYLHFTSPDFPGRVGIGECAPLPALSCDDLPDYEDILIRTCRQVEEEREPIGQIKPSGWHPVKYNGIIIYELRKYLTI